MGVDHRIDPSVDAIVEYVSVYMKANFQKIERIVFETVLAMQLGHCFSGGLMYFKGPYDPVGIIRVYFFCRIGIFSI